METEIVLHVVDGENQIQASRGFLYPEEIPVVPTIGDSILFVVADAIYRGNVFARHFDYSDEARIRIVLDAREK